MADFSFIQKTMVGFVASALVVLLANELSQFYPYRIGFIEIAAVSIVAVLVAFLAIVSVAPRLSSRANDCSGGGA